MADLTERIYRLTVDGTSAARQLEQISRTAAKTESAMGTLSNGLKLLGGTAIVGTLVQGFTKIMGSMDAVAQAADRLGVSTDAVQEVAFAFKQSGSDAETAEKMLAKLSDGAVRNADAFAKLGIATRDSNGEMKTADMLLEGAADAIAALQNPTERTAAAVTLFGKEGAKLVPLLSEGSAGLRAMRQEAQDTGQVIDEKAVAAAKRLNDDWAKLTGTMWTWLANVAGPAVKALSDIAAGTAANAAAVRELRAAQLDTKGNKLIDTDTGEISLSKITAQMSKLSKYMAEARERIRTETDQDIVSSWESGLKKAQSDYEKLDKLLGKKANELGYAPIPAPVVGAMPEIDAAPVKALTENLRGLNDMQRLGAQLTSEYATDVEKLHDKLGDLQAAYEAGEISETTRARGIAETNAKLRELDPTYQRFLEMYEEGRALTLDVSTQEELRAAELDRLKKLLDAAAISQETYNRAVEKVEKKYAGPDGVIASTDEFNKQLTNLAGGAMRDIFNGSDSAGESIARLTKRIAEAATEVMIITPLLEAMNKAMKGSNLFGGLLGGGTSAAAELSLPAPHVTAFAKGGVLAGPTLFPLSGGLGLGGEAGFEAIMPLKRGPDGSLGVAGGGVTVNIINQAGAQVETRERQGPGDSRVIDVMVTSAVERAIGSGRFDRTFAQVYGVKREGRK